MRIAQDKDVVHLFAMGGVSISLDKARVVRLGRPDGWPIATSSAARTWWHAIVPVFCSKSWSRKAHQYIDRHSLV